MKLACKRSAVG